MLYVSKTHSVLVTQDLLRPTLLGFNPLFHPEAVAEEVVILRVGMVYCSESTAWIAKPIRAFPGWLQYWLRCRLEKSMKAY
ncbi:Short-chain dehydrogenase/reductase SDR [Penicillium sp. CMV-2018d]|nr:Short-chain dehydrogenase/reductase SDR [Penicillium sp. CMV-2018d]